MSCDSQIRVRKLAAKWRASQTSPGESAWLESHLSECQPCSTAMAEIENKIRKLRAIGPRASTRLVRTTQLRCRQRSQELAKRNRRFRPLAIACVLACGWASLALPFLWEQLSTFSENNHDLWVHVVFLLMWFMPAMLGVAVALWLRPQLSAEDSSHRVEGPGDMEVVQADRRLRA